MNVGTIETSVRHTYTKHEFNAYVFLQVFLSNPGTRPHDVQVLADTVLVKVLDPTQPIFAVNARETRVEAAGDSV